MFIHSISLWIYYFILIACYFCALIHCAIDPTSSPLLQWNNITVHLRTRNILSLGPGKIYSGRMLGVLGSSGSGKTTFLNILGNRKDHSKGLHYHSDLVVCNEDSEPENNYIQSANGLYGDDVAFVYQHDTFFSMLTVYETLELAASLTLINSKQSIESTQSKLSFPSKNYAKNIVNEAIDSLTLTHISNSKVGNPEDQSIRGISGGERKRLAVACELIGHPKLLLADEPTSGLDSFQAYLVVDRLRKIAEMKSLAVVMTVHQPRTSIWELLDDVMLLGPNGKLIYHGPRNKVLTYFSSLGYPCPQNTNPAEFLIDLVSINTTDSYSNHISRQRIESLALAFTQYNTQHNTQNQGSSKSIAPMKDLPKHLQHSKSYKPSFDLFHPMKHFVSNIGKSLRRFGLLLQRSLRQSMRNISSSLIQIAVSGILALALFAVYGRQPTQLTEASVSNRIIILSNAVINICLLSMITTLQLFKREKAIISRERLQGLYTAHEYLLGKVLAELPLNIAISSVSYCFFYGYVLHYFTNLRCDRLLFMEILSLLSTVTSTMGLAIGSIFQRGDEALSIGPALMIIFLITGAIGPTGAGKALPNFLQPLRTLSPIKWGCEAVAAAEFRNQNFVNLMALPSPNKSMGPLSFVGNVIGGSINKITDGIHLVHHIYQASRNPALRTPMPDGNRALDALGIPDATVPKAIRMMIKMFLSNLLLSWLGLLFTRPK